VDAPELADRSEEFPILRLRRVMGGSRAQKFVAGAVPARAAVVHGRIPLLESDEQDEIHLLGRVGVAEENGVLEFRPPRPKPFREAMEGFFVLDDGGLNERLGSVAEEWPSGRRGGDCSDGDIDMAQSLVEGDNVRRAAQFPDRPNLSRVQVNRDQLLSVTSAEELSPPRIEIEAMRSFGGHLVSLPDRPGSLRLDFHDEGR